MQRNVLKRATHSMIVLLVLLLMLTSITALADTAGGTFVLITENTVLHKAADASSEALSDLVAGQWLPFQASENGFIKVGGTEGYVIQSAAQIADPDTSKQGVIANDGRYVNMHKTAGLHKKVIKHVNDGTVVAINSLSKGWYNVTVDGTTGYIINSMITVGPKAIAYKYIEANDGKGVTLHTGPDASYDILSTIPVGTEIDVLLAGTTWDWVRVNGHVGYMEVAFLKDRDESESIPQTSSTGYVVLKNPTSLLHIREAADLSANVIGTLHVGKKVEVLSQDDHFALIKVGNKQGYVQSQYIKTHRKYYNKSKQALHPNENGYEIATVINPTGGTKVNFRAEPSLHSAVLSEQPIGVEAMVFSKGRNFCKVRLGGEWGYIKSEYLWFK